MARVIFDCFETVVCSTPDTPRPEHWTDLFAEHLSISTIRARRAVYPLITSCLSADAINLSTEEVLRRTVCRGADAPQIQEALEAVWAAAGNSSNQYVAAPGVHAVLAQLRAEGHSVRMLSNCILTQAQMKRLLDELDLFDSFDELHLSSEGLGKKPQPDFFKQAATGSYEAVVMVGDSDEVDLATARQLGWKTVNICTEPDWWSAVLAQVAAI